MPYAGYIRYVGEQVKFFANYTNSSGQAINGSGIYCKFTENSSGSWSTPANMTFNHSISLYEYNKSFSSAGNFSFNVTCDGSSQGYDDLTIDDGFYITPEPLAAVLFITGLSILYGFVRIRKN